MPGVAHRVSVEGAEKEAEDATPLLLRALERLRGAGTWAQGKPCGEPLYQAVPRPRRYPLARLILRRFRHRFQLLIVD